MFHLIAHFMRMILEITEEINFEQDQNNLTFKLMRKEGEMWRDVLKLHLNQKGFHESFKPTKKIGKGI